MKWLTGLAAAVGILAAAVGIFAAIWLNNDDFRVPACTSDDPKLTWLPDAVCPIDTSEVTVAEASEVLTEFIALAGSPSQEGAHKMLASQWRKDVLLENFEKEWSPFLWAERIGQVEKADGDEKGFNKFLVRYRTYLKDPSLSDPNMTRGGVVNEFYRYFVLERSMDGIQISDWTARRNPEQEDMIAEVAAPYREYLILQNAYDGTSVYEEPDSSSAPTYTFRYGGGRIAVMCLVQTTDPYSTVWGRTGIGWFRLSDTTQGDYWPEKGYGCSDYHVSRSG